MDTGSCTILCLLIFLLLLTSLSPLLSLFFFYRTNVDVYIYLSINHSLSLFLVTILEQLYELAFIFSYENKYVGIKYIRILNIYTYIIPFTNVKWILTSKQFRIFVRYENCNLYQTNTKITFLKSINSKTCNNHNRLCSTLFTSIVTPISFYEI